MGTYNTTDRTVTRAWAVILLLPSVAFAPPLSIRTGASTATSGYLEIIPDEYGSWAQPFATGGFGPNADRFLPAGSTLQPVAFSSGFFLFAPGGQRELLSDNADWQNSNLGPGSPFAGDASLSRMVTAPNVAGDFSGDGINDTLNSAFRVFGGGTDLSFALLQRVQTFAAGVSFMRQVYTLTNTGAAQTNVTLLRSFDGDLVWDANFETDSVGTTANGAGLGQFVFEQEPNQAGQSVTLSGGLDGRFYYGGKHGVLPGGGAPAYDFGTDTEQWQANGIPTSWQNHIAGVGYAPANGQSGPAPAGSTVQRDGFIGLDFAFPLAAGGSVTFEVLHTYGQTTPVPEPAGLLLLAVGVLALARRTR